MSARLTALVIALALVAALGVWLHLSVVPDIAWQGHRGDVFTGWGAIRAAWPVYATAGALLALLGLIGGLIAGETARERDAAARAAEAERERDEAREAAARAVADAEAAVSTERAELQHQQQQQQAREQIAAARAARATLDAEAARGRERIAELERELGRCEARLSGARRAMQRGKAETAELHAELAALRSEILP